MNNHKKVCLVIPFAGDDKKIHNLLNEMFNMSLYPNEIIIVNTNNVDLNLQKNTSNELVKKNISIKILNKSKLYPGAARNAGVENTDCELIAFLDILTIPSKDWLKNGLKLLEQDEKNEIVFGTTYYLASNHKEKIIRAATFGEKKIITLPGTILKKNVFLKCGKFIEHVRAGEDADWILRTKLNQIKSLTNNDNLDYEGLLGLEYISVIKKWYINYVTSSTLPYMSSHLRYYYVGFIILVMVISYNWNSIIAGWSEDSNVYVPHITKISFSLIVFVYVLIRGLIIPLRKNVRMFFLLPVNFFKVTILSFFIDLAKYLAFIKTKLNN